MSDVTLNVIRTEALTIKTTEADIRAMCDKHGISQKDVELASLLDRVDSYDGYSWERVLADLAIDTDAESEEWELDDWNTDDEEITTELPAWR
jgi:hypothetical protein